MGLPGILIAGIVIIILAAIVLVGVLGHRQWMKVRSIKADAEGGFANPADEKTDEAAPRDMFSRARLTLSIVFPKAAAVQPRELGKPVTDPSYLRSSSKTPPPEHALSPAASIARSYTITKQTTTDQRKSNDTSPEPFAPYLYNFGSDPIQPPSPVATAPVRDHAEERINDDDSVASTGRGVPLARSTTRPGTGGTFGVGHAHEIGKADSRSRLSVLSLGGEGLRLSAYGVNGSRSPGSRSSFASFAPSGLGPRSSSHRFSIISITSGTAPTGTGSFSSAPPSPGFGAWKFPGRDSRPGSVSSSRSAQVSKQNATSAMNKKVLQVYGPLLPDELHVRLGDTLSLLQAFDDGWGVCAVEGGTGEELRMGCVPLWIFERRVAGAAANVREMRSSSLAVTVDLSIEFDGVPGASGLKPWEREQIVSWSNF